MIHKFITFEGGEGCGKSTQIDLLVRFLKGLDVRVVQTREPGGTVGAEIIRNLLVTGDIDRWHPHTEALLMFASRCEHWNNFIKKHLDAGDVVISDRFADSSFAYQGYARGIDLKGLKSLYQFAVGYDEPDITFLLDIDPKIGLDRTRKRNLNADERFEKESLSFHERVRAGYLAIQKENPKRIVLIDANQDPSSVHMDIIKHLGLIYKEREE